MTIFVLFYIALVKQVTIVVWLKAALQTCHPLWLQMDSYNLDPSYA